MNFNKIVPHFLTKDKLFYLLLATLWLLLATGFDLGSDESHYILYSRFLDWSYFDHPPLVGWIHFVFQKVLGFSNLSARLPSLTLWIWAYLEFIKTDLAKDTADKLIAFATLLVPFALTLFLLPDTPLVPISIGLYRVTQNLLRQNTIKNWIFLGLYLGLAGLSKYSAVLFILPIGAILIYHNQLNILKQLGFWLSNLFAIILISPVLFWNHQNDFISFKYQMHHVIGQLSGVSNFLTSTFMQLIGYGIITALYIVFLITKTSKHWFYNKRLLQKQNLGFLIALSWTIFFIYSSFSQVTLPHWTLIGWLFWYFYFYDNIPRILKKLQLLINVTILISLTLIVWLPISFHHKINLREVKGWPELLSHKSLKIQPDQVLYLSNWSYGSRARLYAPQYLQGKIQIADQRVDQFDIWESKFNLTLNRPGKLLLFKGDRFEFEQSPIQCKLEHADIVVEDVKFKKWRHEFDVYSCLPKI
jgi:hypothetical protein